MSKSRCNRVVLYPKGVSEVCLYSNGVVNCMLQLGRQKAATLGGKSNVYAVEHYGSRSNRAHVFIDTSYEEASKNNALLRVMK